MWCRFILFVNVVIDFKCLLGILNGQVVLALSGLKEAVFMWWVKGIIQVVCMSWQCPLLLLC